MLSTSVAALLLGGGTQAFAACTPVSATYNNPTGTTVSGLCVTNSFTGSISNNGTISPNGIRFTGGTLTGYVQNNATVQGGINFAGSTVTGFVASAGMLTGGITVDASSRITASGITAVTVTDSTFAGGISNAGTITNTSGFGIVDANSGTFSGGITNTGLISSSGSGGGVDVADVSAFSGGVSNSGTISATAPYGVSIFGDSTFAGGISNTGTISGARDGIYIVGVSSFSGGIANSGRISGGSANTAIFVNNLSTFSGGISNTGTISGGTGIVVINASPVSIFDSGTVIGTGGVAVDLRHNYSSATGNIFTLGGGYSITGSVYGSINPNTSFAGNDTLQLGGTTAGSFNLSQIGTQYLYFSTYNVVGGTWTVSGSTATDWTISGGTLTGSAIIGGVTVAAGGTFAPGAPGAAMTVNGNLVLQSAAVYMVTINGANTSSANVSGSTTIATGARFAVAAGSTPVLNTTYVVMTAANGITGSFVNPNIFFGSYEGTLSQVGNNIDLTIGYGSLQPLLPANAPANVVNVANAIDTAIQNGTTPPPGFQALFNLPPAQLQAALSQISGEASTDAGKGASQMMTDLLNLMLDPVAGGGATGGGGTATGFAPERDVTLPTEIALAYAKAFRSQATQPAQQPGWTAWGSAFGAASNTSGNAALGTNSVTARDAGVAAGMEYRLNPNLAYGFSLAGGGTNWNLAQALGSGRSDTFMAGAYAKGHVGSLYLSAALAFANNWFTTNRTALGDQLQATFTGQSYAARGEAGYRYALPVSGSLVGITPYAALQAQTLRTPGYSERDLTGGGLGLTYAAANSTDTRSEFGARFDNLQTLNGMPLVLRGRLAWAHDWVGNPALNATFQALPGASFTVNGAAVPKDSALTTAAAELHVNANWTAIAKFDGQFAGASQTYSGTGTLRYAW